MSAMVEDRVEVGTCDMGNVFIFHRAEKGDYTDKPVNDTWMVRAGNHTVGTYNTEARANAVAIALCGNDRVNNKFAASDSYAANIPELVPPAVKEYVDEVRKKVTTK